MIIKQVSVFLQNQLGRLGEVTDILAQKQINVSALNIAETAEYGVLRMIVNDADATMAILKEHEFSAKITDVLCMEVPDVPGSLHDILNILSAEGINLSYMYGYSNGGTARLILKVSDPQAAQKLLS